MVQFHSGALGDTMETHTLSKEQLAALNQGTPVIITRPGSERLEMISPEQ